MLRGKVMKKFIDYLNEASKKYKSDKQQYFDRKRSEQDVGEGMFNMRFIASLEDLPLEKAKELAKERAENSKAKANNVRKAIDLINKSNKVDNLMISLANFSFSHQGLGTIR